MLNYTIHELNRTVLIKKGQDLQSHRWLNSKLSLQEQGLISCLGDVGVTGQALRAGLQGPLGWGSSLTLRTRPRQKAHPMQKNRSGLAALPHSFPSLSFPFSNNSFIPAALFANHAAKAWLFYLLFVCLFACLKENCK
ncbi:hypothetical protein HJG60_012100 [Phyllostomus discolor]|uniref:Uncharacterized protein n=1 Tax=Phyllostomus discolor TaxID=89673 RepID=A0A833ZEU0_9CHIR|nr:hypothetical protein HJG60_012100 [Phyllostomus discolor]